MRFTGKGRMQVWLQVRSGGYEHVLAQPALGVNTWRHTCSTDLRLTNRELDVMGSDAARLERLLRTYLYLPACTANNLLDAMCI